MSSMVSETLLKDLKTDQDITWEDPDTDRKITNHAELGMAYLNDKLGTPGDYESPGLPRTLLFEYVRYARSGALDVFEANYLSLILAMQNGKMVESYAQQKKTIQA